MTPAQWAEALRPAVPWQAAYKVVAEVTRALLAAEPGGDHYLTTSDLVERLFPEHLARGEGITARRRMFSALAALAKHDLADCATRGPARKMKHLGKMVHPWHWHRPVEKPAEPCCPTCGQPIAF